MSPPASRMILRIVIAVAAIAGTALVVRNQTRAASTQAAAKKKGPAVRAVPVLMTAVEQRDVPVWLEGLGTVAAWQQVTLRAQVEGRLDEVFFKEGETVKKGQLLAQIDPRPFRAQLLAAEGALARDRAQLKGGKLNLDRYKTLLVRQLGSQQQLDDQVAVVGQNEGAIAMDLAQVQTARINLGYTRITSPLDGVTGVRQIDPGNLVRASDPTGIVVVTQLDPAAVFLTLPQDDLPRIAAAMKRGDVPVEAWSRDGKVRLGIGKVVALDNTINQSTATIRLKAQLPNKEGSLWPNQFVKARVLVDTEKEAMVIPAASVLRGPSGTLVYIAKKDNTVEARPIEVLITTAEIAVVNRKNLKAGEKVVVEGQNQLRPGAKITSRPAKGAPGAKVGKPEGKPEGKGGAPAAKP